MNKSMNKSLILSINKACILFITILFSSFVVLCKPAKATIAVIDSANLANSAKQVAAWSQQLAEMKQQLEQARAQYIAITGSRNLGDILYNPQLRQYLPPEYQNIYDAAYHGNYGISGTIADIEMAERLTGTINEMQSNIEERTRRKAITDKAVGLKAYELTRKRLDQIESLMKQISNTQDLKAIGELQARIAIEQATVQNEITKLQMISQLQQAESKLIKMQKHEMHQRIINNNNTKLPRIE